MAQINAFTNYLRETFKIKFWWVIVPFAFIGLLFAGLFYLFTPIYMLFDLARFELRKILYSDNEKLSGAAQFIKFAISYFGYFLAAVLTIFQIGLLSMMFMLTFLAFFISSLGRVRGNPFKFHEITESK